MAYTAIINLVSKENVIIENFQLSKALKYVFIGDSEIALPYEEIINVKLILNRES